jgi:hypothetical protein
MTPNEITTLFGESSIHFDSPGALHMFSLRADDELLGNIRQDPAGWWGWRVQRKNVRQGNMPSMAEGKGETAAEALATFEAVVAVLREK